MELAERDKKFLDHDKRYKELELNFHKMESAFKQLMSKNSEKDFNIEMLYNKIRMLEESLTHAKFEINKVLHERNEYENIANDKRFKAKMRA